MAEMKGKFITLAGVLMSAYQQALESADKELVAMTGKTHKELDPEGWYDTKIFELFMAKYAEGSPTGEGALVTLGRMVYPTIKRTAGIPEKMTTPLQLILWEAEGFALNHRGNDVTPRKFIKKEEGCVIVQAPAPGYNQKLFEGVYLGILEMYGIKNGRVSMTRGAPEFEYEIVW